MQLSRAYSLSFLTGLSLLSMCLLAIAEESDPAANVSGNETPVLGATPEELATRATVDVPRVSLEVARDRARLMHDLYSATLDSMHHHYFHVDRATLPARAMVDIFKEIEQQYHSKSNWISASFKPMNIDHKPQTEFEKLAARKIAQGDDFVETIDAGYYRRAGSISLNRGCISCHSGSFGNTSTARKFAGLVISIPVEETARLTQED